MKVGSIIKVPTSQANSGVYLMPKHRSYIKGFVEVNHKLRIGYDADDFIKDLFTVIHEYNRIKIPRILNRRKIKDRYK